MTASSPVTMEDLVNGLKFHTSSTECNIVESSGQYFIFVDPDNLNSVSLSSDGLTITFGEGENVVEFTGFTYED